MGTQLFKNKIQPEFIKDEGSPPSEILLTFHLEWHWERRWYGAWQRRE